MGVVYRAEDLTLKRTVALKLLSHQALADKDQKARFLREAQAAAGLDHPNICTVYEVGEAHGETFIAMAYLDGQSLQDQIAAGLLEIDEALAPGVVGVNAEVDRETASSPASPLVGIEEPEIALHPAAAGILLDSLRDASGTTQVHFYEPQP